VIAGDGPERRALTVEVEKLDLADRVHLLGHGRALGRPAARERHPGDVLTGRRPGSVVLHALALGKPVVSTAGGGLVEIVPPGGSCRWGTPTLSHKE